MSISEKVDLAAEAGAEVAVVFNDNLDEGWLYFFNRILEDTKIPAIGINNDQGRALARALLGGAQLEVKVKKVPVPPVQSRNVVAELNNDIEDDKRLVIGAHYDTTYLSPGANDNGSGLAAAMVAAQELLDTELPFDLAFVLFGAEETRLNGSHAHIMALGPQEWERTMGMVNLDAIGAGNLNAIGSDEMLDLAVQTAADIEIVLGTVSFSDAYSSDHLPFRTAGIPWVHIFADDFSVLNTPSDTLDLMQRAPLVHATELALGLVERLAKWQLGPDGLWRVEIIVSNGSPELVLVTGLPDGRYDYGRYSIDETASVIIAGVFNLKVVNPDIAGITVYETEETRIPLEQPVTACAFYEVQVNGETHQVQAVESGQRCS